MAHVNARATTGGPASVPLRGSGRWRPGVASGSGTAASRPFLHAACPPRHRHLLAARASSSASNTTDGTVPKQPQQTGASSSQFDWRLALSLAGCSFESYNGLEGSSLQQVSPQGATITYVDQRFLQQHMAGLLEVTVHSASGLRAADWGPWGKSDPYAIVNVGDSSATTKVVPSNLNPIWEETFYLFLADAKSQRLSVRVLDEDIGKADDFLGASLRGLQDLTDGESHRLTLPLRDTTTRDAGSVELSVRLLPFTDVLASQTAASSMGGPVCGSPASAFASSPWRELQKALGAAADAMFDPLAMIDNPESDTQAWVFWNPEARQVCVAFRGTEQTQWKDVLTDLTLTPASWGVEGVEEAGPGLPNPAELAKQGLEGLTALGRSLRQPPKLEVPEELPTPRQLLERQLREAVEATQAEQEQWVHTGFLRAYESVRPQVLRLLDTLFAGDTCPWTLYLTGHSLGGALSTLCAFDCAQRSWRGGPRPALVHYNYGSPRVGNRAFATEFNALVPNTWRVANRGDAVALVPRLLGYCHVGHKVELDKDGRVAIELNTAEGLVEGASATQVAMAVTLHLPKLAEQVMGSADGGDAAAEGAAAAKDAVADASSATGAAGAAADQDLVTLKGVQQVLEEEVDSLMRLVDGSAVMEHLEPVYLENLKAALDRLDTERRQA